MDPILIVLLKWFKQNLKVGGICPPNESDWA